MQVLKISTVRDDQNKKRVQFAIQSLSLFFPSSATATLNSSCSQAVSFLLLECSSEVVTTFFFFLKINAITIHHANLKSVSTWMFSYSDDPVQVC